MNNKANDPSTEEILIKYFGHYGSRTLQSGVGLQLSLENFLDTRYDESRENPFMAMTGGKRGDWVHLIGVEPPLHGETYPSAPGKTRDRRVREREVVCDGTALGKSCASNHEIVTT